VNSFFDKALLKEKKKMLNPQRLKYCEIISLFTISVYTHKYYNIVIIL